MHVADVLCCIDQGPIVKFLQTKIFKYMWCRGNKGAIVNAIVVGSIVSMKYIYIFFISSLVTIQDTALFSATQHAVSSAYPDMRVKIK